jgi:phosphoribosylformimino-5-aminoimidazole carboxamide ribonucleotide (ProFAR) isomerase
MAEQARTIEEGFCFKCQKWVTMKDYECCEVNMKSKNKKVDAKIVTRHQVKGKCIECDRNVCKMISKNTYEQQSLL